MQLWQEWWVWTVAGVALAVLEILAPGYIFLGFAIGAVANGALLWFGIAPTSLPWLLLIFALISLASWFAMRAIFGIRRGQVKIWEDDINEN